MEGFDAEVDVFFNDQIPFHSLSDYDKVVISPGPGLPHQAGELMRFIKEYHHKIPILGVCLGFQALVEFFGGQIYNQNEVKHGVSEDCFFKNDSKLFDKTPNTYKIGLYHSWAAKKDNFPPELDITAQSKNKVIMAFEHKKFSICGVQFHPESIITENGHQIIKNFLVNF